MTTPLPDKQHSFSIVDEDTSSIRTGAKFLYTPSRGVAMRFVVHVHVGGTVVTVPCGCATQRIKWLAHVGVSRVDNNLKVKDSVPSPSRFMG